MNRAGTGRASVAQAIDSATSLHQSARMTHRLEIRVYYEDTDFAGVVYYANYLRFIERGRTEALRALGIDQSQLREETGIVFVVSRLEIAYRAPARFDDILTVETRTTRVRAASLEMEQVVRRGREPIAEARVVVGVIGPSGRPVRLPPEVREALDRMAGSE